MVIYGDLRSLSNKYCNLPTLHVHHYSLRKCIFEKIKSPKDKLHRLRPQLQDTSHNTWNTELEEYLYPKGHT